MRYQELIESAYSNIDKDKKTEFLSNYRSQIRLAFESPPIYRGMDSTATVIFGDGTLLNRTSTKTDNYFTLLTSIVPSWQGWPTRNKSFICSSSHKYASQYGESVYRVIPLENQKIAIASRDDIWDSFKVGLGLSIETFNYCLKRVAKDLDLTLSQTDPHTLLKTLEQMPTHEKFHESAISLDNNIIRWFKAKSTVLDSFSYALDPIRNNNKLEDWPLPYTPDNKEIWLTGKVLFVAENTFDYELKDLFKEKTPLEQLLDKAAIISKTLQDKYNIDEISSNRSVIEDIIKRADVTDVLAWVFAFGQLSIIQEVVTQQLDRFTGDGKSAISGMLSTIKRMTKNK